MSFNNKTKSKIETNMKKIQKNKTNARGKKYQFDEFLKLLENNKFASVIITISK